MLQQFAHWNDLSPELRKKLEEKVASLGPTVSYRFNISHRNPDPEKYNGDIVWPKMWTLDPITFRIVDKLEEREGKSKSKQIGMVDELDEKGLPKSFHRIRVFDRHKGVLFFNLEESQEDQMYVAYLEMHPKLAGGMFYDARVNPVIERIDTDREARESRQKRQKRLQAYNVAKEMSEPQLREFAAAMLWDEKDKLSVLKDKTEALSETNPEMFEDLIENKSLEFRAVVKRALDQSVLAYDPTEEKILYGSNQETVAMLGPNMQNRSTVERFAEWLLSNGDKSDKIYKKIKGLVKV